MNQILATFLYVCINPTWAGCGTVTFVDYGTPEACREALSSMVVATNGKQAIGGEGRSVIAFCRPPSKPAS